MVAASKSCPVAVATVVSVTDQRVELESAKQAECQLCARGEGCGGGLFRPVRESIISLPVNTSDEVLAVGDVVELRFAEGAMLRGAALIYGLPVGLMIVSLLIAAALFELTDLLVLLVALVSLVCGFFTSRVFASRWQRELRLQWQTCRE